ncbi:MAG: dTMP kinase [Alphaproteobacteria bacterium]|nr:dTMP kinase [Alphaproteobacteria bacterium]
MNRDIFITFEGGEGSGKTTQVKKLAEFLEKKYKMSCVLTREPGGSEGAEKIRDIALKGNVNCWDATTEALLMFAARRDHFVKVIKPALAEGKCVICDRFADSSYAYQGYGYKEKGVPLKDLDNLYKMVLGDFKPSITFVLDLPVEVGLDRAKKRDVVSNRYEQMKLDFHNNLRNAFLKIAKENPERVFVIDATQDIDQIHNEICDIVSKRIDSWS